MPSAETDPPAEVVDAERVLATNWRCWEGSNTALVYSDGAGRMIYDFLDVLYPERPWCRKLATYRLIEARSELDFDFWFDHLEPAEAID